MSQTPRSTAPALAFSGFHLLAGERAVLRAGAPVKLGARAFDVLVALIERRERIVTKDELFDLVWPGLIVEESNLQVQVSALRKVLGQGVIATIPGRGYQFVARVDDAATGTGSDRAVPNNLPQSRTQFIGRGKELAQCAQLLRDTQLLTLTGVGGCGKTRLAVQLALQQAEAFADGLHFVDLAPLQSSEGVSGALATVVGVHERVGTSLVERVAEHLAPRRALILFDNCEHVIDAVATLGEELLRCCPRIKILATSREGLGLAGEQLYSVRPLSLPATHELAAMDASEAVRLFVDRARLVVPDLVVDSRNAATIAEICRRLDGLALAIELAAARTSMLSFDEIRERLDKRFRLLSGGTRALPRQQTLQATMQWSHDLLSHAEQCLFRKLSVFAGGWTLKAAAEIANLDDEYEMLHLLTRLHDKSLVQVDRGVEATPRYGMLETVRQYALDQLGESGDSEVIRMRHLMHFSDLADEAGRSLSGPEESAWVARLRPEQENLLSAHIWARDTPQGVEPALRMVDGLKLYWMSTGQAAIGYRLARAALERVESRDFPLLRCRSLTAASACAFQLGRYEESALLAQESLELARAAQDRALVLHALRRQASALQAQGKLDRAAQLFEEALALAQETDSREGMSAVYIGLGEVRRALGDLTQAAACYEQSIALERRANPSLGLAAGLRNLTCTLVSMGHLERARHTALECTRITIAIGAKSRYACVLECVVGLAEALGDSARAARLYGGAEMDRQRMQMPREPVDEAFIAPLMTQARSALGELQYAKSFDSGRCVPFDDLFTEAMHWLERAAH